MIRDAMADLEEHAIKRDKGFLVKLVVLLLAGLGAGLLIYSQLTGARFAGCAAQTFDTVSDPGVQTPPQPSH